MPAGGNVLEKLATFLKDIAQAWDQASQEQRNRLAKCLLETVWIKDKKVVAVTPQPEFEPFFDLQYDRKSNYKLVVRPRGASASYLQDLETGLFPVIVSVPFRSGHKLLPSIWPEVAERHKTESLRQLAKGYGVSHEAVRRTLAVIKSQTKLAET